ncbi:MAG: GGDEF domain-containing protein [Rhizobiaceae bacterium MnEN-MB40S]|nr:MAG: GGDEF domain-containing protein [Rhizobiaceae bacterium MnEN-MB40S]
MEFAIKYIYSFGTMALLAVAFGISLQFDRSEKASRVGLGLLFGGAATLAMNNPIPIADGVIVDPRNLFVGLSAAFLGVWGGAPALLVAISTRFYLGGAGVGAGILSMTIASCAGYAWSYMVRDRVHYHPGYLLLLGGMISFSLIGILLLPRDAMIQVFVAASPFIVAFNLIGAMLFGGLMERERNIAFRYGRMQNEAVTDPLTGLLNRRGFTRIIDHLPEKIKNKAGAVLVVDLDRFKTINDTYGHDTGDSVLVSVATQLKSCVRKSDVVARFGGEEFVILLPETSEEEARQIAERLRETVCAIRVTLDSDALPVTTSIGGHWNGNGINLLTALRLADRALYRAKQEGRNRTEFAFDPAMADYSNVA